MFENDSRRVYEVVRNHQGQHSIWPHDRELPPGWTTIGLRGTKETCLSGITRVWTDCRPAGPPAERPVATAVTTMDDHRAAAPAAAGAAPEAAVMAGGRNKWLAGRPLPGAAARLYCFAHSGGSVGEYLRWQAGLPGVELRGVQLPGRGERYAEPVISDLSALVRELVDQVDFQPPFVFFGHSCGALIAFEVARELRRRGRPMPDSLLLSAFQAAHLERTGDPLHALPDEELLAAIDSRYGGLPEQFWQEPEIVELALPAYRADFALFETYRHRPDEPLDLPIRVIGGSRDRVARDALAAWHVHTTGDFHLHILAGDHFYFRSDRAPLLDLISRSTGFATAAVPVSVPEPDRGVK